ncbi:hypothetical protein I5G59_gp20 [Mycobacterium phage LilMcDreamy]|uniref:Uncharacterized protein n=1 Tax=Mycobacterium phage LilMcDreamy TaxID=2652422 RepID=A0A5P8D977_9CAUD|nr:hypothetical protein I5G59_gp20 [Mycobacterium phage LilMcDreamy]QFP94640.1 hypothetical protein SEA_LILMCDREAMY_20 [Mycobacterium phage LilMcDreamy]
MPDPAIEVVSVVMDAVGEAFATPTGPAPTVRFFAGDGPALSAWDSHASQGCAEPFIWVLASRRYRSQTFPAPSIDTNPCGLIRVLQLQVGVGRCVNVDEIPNWSAMESEAARSLADSYAIEQALCSAAKHLGDLGAQTGVDTLLPYGPEGGVTAWTGVIYVSL